MELLEESNIRLALALLKPDEIYNLAAQSFVGQSFFACSGLRNAPSSAQGYSQYSTGL